jgi:hypothetical protein
MWTMILSSSGAEPSVASIAAASASISSTTSTLSISAAGLPATVAPAARRGSARAAVRFQTTSGVPARSRLCAIGAPITPRPANPSRMPTSHAL